MQHLFFGHSQVGDLRPYLSGFFDTTSGPKVEASSYKNILLTLGVDDPQQVGTGWQWLPHGLPELFNCQALLIV